VARPPVHVAGTITNDDYPAAAIRAEEEGSVSVRLQVSADGRVESCTVARSSGSAVLDSTTCQLLSARARFEPARDAGGRRVRGSVTRSVRWELPDDTYSPSYPARFAPGFVAVSVPRRDYGPCASVASPVELWQITEDLCREVFPPEGDSMEAPPAVAILSLTGADGVLPRRTGSPGRLTYSEEARFEVRADGTVVDCTQRVTQNSGEETPFDLCRYFATEDGPFFAPAEDPAAAPRAGRATLEIRALTEPFDPAAF
jgi:TonB family protein